MKANTFSGLHEAGSKVLIKSEEQESQTEIFPQAVHTKVALPQFAFTQSLPKCLSEGTVRQWSLELIACDCPQSFSDIWARGSHLSNRSSNALQNPLSGVQILSVVVQKETERQRGGGHNDTPVKTNSKEKRYTLNIKFSIKNDDDRPKLYNVAVTNHEDIVQPEEPIAASSLPSQDANEASQLPKPKILSQKQGCKNRNDKLNMRSSLSPGSHDTSVGQTVSGRGSLNPRPGSTSRKLMDVKKGIKNIRTGLEVIEEFFKYYEILYQKSMVPKMAKVKSQPSPSSRHLRHLPSAPTIQEKRLTIQREGTHPQSTQIRPPGDQGYGNYAKPRVGSETTPTETILQSVPPQTYDEPDVRKVSDWLQKYSLRCNKHPEDRQEMVKPLITFS